MFAVSESFGSTRTWRYIGPPIAGIVLPLLGTALGIASFGPGLSRGFRIAALIVAAFSIAGVLMPTLAE